MTTTALSATQKPAGVIETHHTDAATEWGYSFTSHNPEPDDYIRCASEADACKLAKHIRRIESALASAEPVAFVRPSDLRDLQSIRDQGLSMASILVRLEVEPGWTAGLYTHAHAQPAACEMPAELWDWLENRGLIPDLLADGSYDVGDLISALNAHEDELEAVQPAAKVETEETIKAGVYDMIAEAVEKSGVRVMSIGDYVLSLIDKPAATPASDYPECSGDPASCPENDGHGCCKPNPVKTPAGVPDVFREHGNSALAHISNALDDLESSRDQRPVPLLNEAMFHIHAMLTTPEPRNADQ